jgi:hypothetical protein
MSMLQEVIGVVIFSGFMLCLVALLVGNLLLALYRERRARRDAQGGPREE